MQASKMNISDLNVDIIPSPSNRSSGEFSFGDSIGSYGFIVPDRWHINRYHICWNVDLCLSISIVSICRRGTHLFPGSFQTETINTSHEARPSPRPDLRPGRQVLDLSHVKTQRLVAESLRRSKIGELEVGEEEFISQMCFQKGLLWQVGMF